MKWLDGMNAAIDYMECHLLEKVDLADVARIAYCSLSGFQRMFVFATDIPAAEYIRRRRMSLSAFELIHSGGKIVDIAAKYGCDSPEAFSRAFRAFHGVSPASARKLGQYTQYPRITFEIHRGGADYNMGTKPLVRIEEHDGERVAAFPVNCVGPEEAAWNALRQWAVSCVADHRARRYIGCAPRGHHPDGEEHRANEEAGHHEYVAQMLLLGEEGKDGTFLGAPVCDAPKGLYLVGDVALNEFDDKGDLDIGSSMMKAYAVLSECLNDMGSYEFDLQARPYQEEHIFSDEWFRGSSGLAGFRLWLSIRKV